EIARSALRVCVSLRAAVIAVIDGEFRFEEIDGQNLAVPFLRRATVRRAERTYCHCTTQLAACYLFYGAPRDIHPRPRSATLAIFEGVAEPQHDQSTAPIARVDDGKESAKCCKSATAMSVRLPSLRTGILPAPTSS